MEQLLYLSFLGLICFLDSMTRIYLYTFLAAVCCVLLGLYFLNLSDYIWIPKCPIKILLGIDCPGCGFQRAMHALLHGHIKEAVSYNLFFVVAFPYLIIILLSDFMRKGKQQQKLRSFVESKWLTNGYIVSFVIWFVIRNIANL